MTIFERWCEDLQRTLSPTSDDDPVDLDRVKDLALRARQIAPGLDGEQREQLIKGVQLLHRVVSDGMARIDGDLSNLNQKRKGIRGYGQLRSNHLSQRLHRRA